nr:unnamed protein product [Callosobruchus analis]CAI5862609.1 unnamed protein product [Callosobruchus analis]
MKKNLILALKNRVIRLSHPHHKIESLQKLKTLLIENSYPIKFINTVLFNYNQISIIHNHTNTNNIISESPNQLANNTIDNNNHLVITQNINDRGPDSDSGDPRNYSGDIEIATKSIYWTLGNYNVWEGMTSSFGDRR